MNRPARRRSSYKKILEEQQQQQQQPQPSSAGAAAPSSSAANSYGNNNNTTMDGANRKIELQSPEDLTFLINNVRRAAAEHIGAAFPPVEGDDVEEDELRIRIEHLVNDYIHQIFTLAAPNLSINGFDLDASTFPAVYLSDLNPNNSSLKDSSSAAAAGPEIQYEPFDGRKRARVEELAREEEDLMREIAALKRKIPAAAARGYADGFWEGVRGDEEAFERAKELAAVPHPDVAVVGNSGGGGGEAEDQEDKDKDKDKGDKENEADEAQGGKRPPTKAMLDGLGRVDRVEDVERGYAGVIETLGRLKREMPATVAKMERARVAGEYVVTER